MGHQPSGLMTSNAALLESGQSSDLTVRCGEKEYLLHRAIVCPRFDFLAIACDGQFKEGATGVIDLPDDDPATFARMIDYLYTLKYDDGSGEDSNPLSVALANTLVYAMADKYNIADLATLAIANFHPVLRTLSDDAFLVLVEMVVTTTPPSRNGLRSPIIVECVRRMERLVNIEGFRCLLGDYAELGAASVLEGFRTMQLKVDKLEHELDTAKKTIAARDNELHKVNTETANWNSPPRPKKEKGSRHADLG